MLCDVCVLSFSGDRALAATQLAERFGISQAEAIRVVNSAPIVVKRRVVRAAAREMEHHLREIGAEVVIQASAAVDPSAIAPSPLSMAPPAVTPSPLSVPPAIAPSPPSVTPSPPVAPAPTPGSVAPAPPAAPAASTPLAQPTPSIAPRWQAPPPLLGAPDRKRFVVSRGMLTMVGTLVAITLLYLWWRTPTMGGLGVHTLGGGRSGDPAIILLHGYGAPGDDLVPLAEEVLALEAMPNVQVIVPEGIVSMGLNGRAWYDSTQELAEARTRVSALIDELIDDGTPPERIVLGGFSQGAMMALDVGLRHRPRIYGVAMLSGKRVPANDWKPLLADLETTRFLITHGRNDRVVPFRPAEQISEELTAAGAKVSWVPFDGAHQIPPVVRGALASFCSEMATSE